MVAPLAAASVGLQVMGMIQGHQASQQQAASEAAIGAQNAYMLERQASALALDIELFGRSAGAEAMTIREQGEQTRAAGRVAFAGAGIVADTGTALNWSRGLESEIQEDLVRLDQRFQNEVRGVQMMQNRLREEAVVSRWSGQVGAATARMQGTAQLLTGAARIAGTGYSMSRDID